MNRTAAIHLMLCALLSASVALSAEQPAGGSPRKRGGAAANSALAVRKTDACALLTSAEIAAVQGETIQETNPSAQASGGLLISQCLFRTVTFAKSVSLALTMPDPADRSALTPREFWRGQFHPPIEEERERELHKPRPIGGLGEEAYWVGNAITGALYVLQGDAFLRISVGGIREESARIEKSKALARAALKRLGRKRSTAKTRSSSSTEAPPQLYDDRLANLCGSGR